MEAVLIILLMMIPVLSWVISAYLLAKFLAVPLLCKAVAHVSCHGSRKIERLNRIYGPPPMIIVLLLLPTMPVFWMIGYCVEFIFRIDLPIF